MAHGAPILGHRDSGRGIVVVVRRAMKGIIGTVLFLIAWAGIHALILKPWKRK